ncbi:hypothetical protein DB88DRAFT_508456 [Papiliotrema laurentii]|uniref:NADH-ubiquinone oxidoreductase 9.5 kDa subunit n=1 Tax=Papiliotrema laurentii TaxID=5418 RepID=A0AAD9FUA3_PAPLA|nr:hypothetical protein DB88DRAFT_508456 [Papiliotrema laurentii]
MSNVYRYMQRMAHEQPVIFWSLALGALGPTMVLTVPPIRKNFFGYKSPEPIPTSFPVPNRPRRPTTGYEDP